MKSSTRIWIAVGVIVVTLAWYIGTKMGAAPDGHPVEQASASRTSDSPTSASPTLASQPQASSTPDLSVDDWKRFVEVDQLTNRSTAYLASEQWNADGTIYTQSIAKCVDAEADRNDNPPDARIRVNISVFDAAKEALPLLWTVVPNPLSTGGMPFQITHINVTHDGGETVVDQVISESQFTNSIDLDFDYFFDEFRVLQNNDNISGQFRIQLTAQDGREVVVSVPARSSKLFRSFTEADCPHVGHGSMQLMFDNQILVKSISDEVLGHLYYSPDGSLLFVDVDGKQSVGTWHREGKTLCGALGPSAPAELNDSLKCSLYRQFKRVDDFQFRNLTNGKTLIFALLAGRPTDADLAR